MDQTLAGFDQTEWEALCRATASEAQKCCGSVHEIYVRLYSEAVDRNLAKMPEEHRVRAVEIATDWDYASPQQRHQIQLDLEQQGLCSHGLHPDNCPLGCGSLPDCCEEEH